MLTRTCGKLVEGSHLLVERFFRGLGDDAARSLKQNPLKAKFAAAHPWFARLSAGPQHGTGADAEAVRAAEEEHTREYMQAGTEIDGVRLRVVECCGSAGDAIVWHPAMVHASAANCAAVPRFMRNTCLQASG